MSKAHQAGSLIKAMSLKFNNFKSQFCAMLIACLGSTSSMAYEAGTFTFKPINANITSMSFGLQKKDSKFRTVGLSFPTFQDVPVSKTESAYRSPVSFGFQESDGAYLGYGVEAGYLVAKNWEIFGRVGYGHQHPNGRTMFGDLSTDFKPRNNTGFGIGSRLYFETASPWQPFVGAGAGVTLQGETKLTLNMRSGHFTNTDLAFGTYKVFGRKTLYSGEISAGTDYVFNKNLALTLSVALRYSDRGGATTLTTPPFALGTGQIVRRTLYYKDNRQRWYLPITMSLKFMF
jgi:hypothetical protein